MKVTITIEDNLDNNEVTLTSTFCEGVLQATNSTATWMGMKLIARATELARERKKLTSGPSQSAEIKKFKKIVQRQDDEIQALECRIATLLGDKT